MAFLIGNGSSLYRRDASLVRTPITITLGADDSCGYSVCGSYTSSDFPFHGITHGTTPGNMRSARERLESMLINPPSASQHWRQVTTAGYQVEFAWHQGSLFLSAPYPDLVYTQGETYMQLCGYHFTIPESLDDLEVTAVRIKYHNGGTIICGGEPQEAGAAYRRSLGGFAGYYARQGVSYQYPYTIWYGGQSYKNPGYYVTTPIDTSFPVRFVSMAEHPYYSNTTYNTLMGLDYDEVDLSAVTEQAISQGAGIGGWRRLWTNGGPGALPILSNAGSRIEVVDAENNVDVINGNRSAWFFVFAPLSTFTRKLTIGDLEQGTTPPYTSLNELVVERTDLSLYSHIYANWSRSNLKGQHGWATQTPNVAAASLWGLSLEVDLG